MGNIMSLKRLGLLDDGTYGMIDNLSLKYDGNQLTSVKDDGGYPTYSNAWNFPDEAEVAIEYEYDANGNVTKDLNRNILSIQYNSLNLPAKIEFEGNKTIKYTYSADGRKLRAEYTTALPATSKIIDYCGNMIFENGQIQQINVDGGYATYIGSSWAYHFYAKDHLGNNRVVVHPSGLNQQPQVNNYYPFGGLMASSTNQNQQRYKYNGKEFDRMHGLDWYDYGARWMDASIGRWHSIDPLCEKYYSTSPYVYCVNNPMKYVDPDGRKIVISDNASEEFKRQVQNAFSYLDAHNAAEIWKQLDERPEVIILNEHSKQANYAEKDGIYWNPKSGLYTDSNGEGHRLSPAIRLLHEMGHQLQRLAHSEAYNTEENGTVWHTPEEERNIR